MQNGFIYPLTCWLVSALKAVNAVEYLKQVFAWTYRRYKRRGLTEEEIIAAKNVAIDSFMALKWLIVAGAICFGCQSFMMLFVVWYLIASNLFTYFYYHVWGSGFALRVDLDSQRRRYVNFVLSLAFYIVCYAYLFQFQYSVEIQWPDRLVDTTNAIYLSIANAFTLTYGGFAPKSQTARILFASELINTFFFFTIIISNSIPSHHGKD